MIRYNEEDRLNDSKKATTWYALAAVAVIIAGLAVRGTFGAAKSEYHIDEGYSAALTNGDWLPGKDMAPHDEWLDSGKLFSLCFIDRLAAGGSPELAEITNATAEDVHPPLYYWLFAFFRVAVGASHFALAGYLLNLALFAISCALVAFIAWKAWRDWLSVLAVLALFAFSSVSISLTIFIRMYELLQTLCLGLLACAFVAMEPPEGRLRSPAIVLAVIGVFAVSFLGLLTQYYFLFFAAPVALVAAVWLLARKRPATLLWCALAMLAGLYLAYRVFPAMKMHLTESYRAEQSVANLVKSGVPGKLANLGAYLAILSRNLVPFAVLVAVFVLAIVERVRKAWIAREGAAGSAGTGRSKAEIALFALALATFAFTFVVVAISAPYQTARYIGSFFPVYALAFIGLSRLVLGKKTALVMMGAAALLVFAHGVNPRNVCNFHEDYVIEPAAFYMTDAKPVILIASPEGGSWKNIMPYLNFGKGKRVYVTSESMGRPVEEKIRAIARTSGEREVYAIVDDYFKRQPDFEKIGWYGFYFVYRVTVD